jgi:hypothetical protein
LRYIYDMNRLAFTKRTPANLPLFRLRNIEPVKAPLSVQLQKLERIGLPRLADPQNFSQRLLQIEQELGTCHAALIGLLTASGLEEIADIKSAVQQFEDIFSRVCREVPETEVHIQRLFDYLSSKLIFVESWDSVEAEQGIGTDLPRALNGLEANLQGENEEIGNCTICSSLFALIQLRLGNLAGEARKQNSMHSLAYAVLENVGYREEYLYNRVARKKFTLAEIQKKLGSHDESWRPFFQEVRQMAINPKRMKKTADDAQQVIWKGFNIEPEVAFCFKPNILPQQIAESFSDGKELAAMIQFREAALNQSRLFRCGRIDQSVILSSTFTFIASLLSIKVDDVFAFQIFEEMNVSQRSSLLDRLLVIGMINPFSYQLEEQLRQISKGLAAHPSWINSPQVGSDLLKQMFPALMVVI